MCRFANRLVYISHTKWYDLILQTYIYIYIYSISIVWFCHACAEETWGLQQSCELIIILLSFLSWFIVISSNGISKYRLIRINSTKSHSDSVAFILKTITTYAQSHSDSVAFIPKTITTTYALAMAYFYPALLHRGVLFTFLHKETCRHFGIQMIHYKTPKEATPQNSVVGFKSNLGHVVLSSHHPRHLVISH